MCILCSGHECTMEKLESWRHDALNINWVANIHSYTAGSCLQSIMKKSGMLFHVCFPPLKSRMLAPPKLVQLRACAVMLFSMHTRCRFSVAQRHKPCNSADATIEGIHSYVTTIIVLGSKFCLGPQVHSLSVCGCPTCLVKILTSMASPNVSGWITTCAAVLVW